MQDFKIQEIYLNASGQVFVTSWEILGIEIPTWNKGLAHLKGVNAQETCLSIGTI